MVIGVCAAEATFAFLLMDIQKTDITTQFELFSEVACSTNPGNAFFAEKKRLRQTGRPHQAYHMSNKNPGYLLAEKKASAAADKNAPSLLQIMIC